MNYEHLAVFLPTDRVDEPALVRAIDLARRGAAKRLAVIDVLPEHPGWLRSILGTEAASEAAARDERSAEIREILARAGADDLDPSIEVRTGEPAEELAQAVVDGGHDVLLKTARNRGPENAALGTVAMRLMRACPCPVWVISRETEGGSVLAAIDATAEEASAERLNRRILRTAAWLADLDGRRLEVLHVFDPSKMLITASHADPEHLRRIEDAARAETKSRLRSAIRDAGLDIRKDRLEIVSARPRDGIVEASKRGVATLVMGTHGRSGLAGFFIGNTAEAVLRRVNCSVLAVKPFRAVE